MYDITDDQPIDYQATEYEIGMSWLGEVKLNRQLKTFDFKHLASVMDGKNGIILAISI